MDPYGVSLTHLEKRREIVAFVDTDNVTSSMKVFLKLGVCLPNS